MFAAVDVAKSEDPYYGLEPRMGEVLGVRAARPFLVLQPRESPDF